MRSLLTLGLILALGLGLAACRSSKEKTYDYDAAAHQRAIDLKAAALGLMANSGDSFSRHRENVAAIGAKIEEAYTLSAAAPENQAVASAWAAMKDPSGNLFGGYMRRWQASGAVDQATREAETTRITTHFDYILCLEAAKRTKGGRCSPPGGAAPVAEEPAAAQ